jgi:hypothetical protein
MVFDFLGVFNFLKIFGSIRDVLPFFLRVSYTHACSAQARLCREAPGRLLCRDPPSGGEGCVVTLTTHDKAHTPRPIPANVEIKWRFLVEISGVPIHHKPFKFK